MSQVKLNFKFWFFMVLLFKLRILAVFESSNCHSDITYKWDFSLEHLSFPAVLPW